MKKIDVLKFCLPIGLGLALLTITVIGLFSSTLSSCVKSNTCPAGTCLGSDGKCYTCSSGGSSTTTYCSSGNTYNFSSQMCCPNSTPYYYPGTHGIKAAGCYASCPYVGDCGTHFQKY